VDDRFGVVWWCGRVGVALAVGRWNADDDVVTVTRPVWTMKSSGWSAAAAGL
jgi:hypothetical protein